MPNLFEHCRIAAYLNRREAGGKVQGESKNKRSLIFAEPPPIQALAQSSAR
jgi:hypothetical protein